MCGLIARMALQVAEDQRPTQRLRQCGKFLIQNPTDIAPCSRGCGIDDGGSDLSRHGNGSRIRSTECLSRQSNSGSVQPGADGSRPPDCARLTREDEETWLGKHLRQSVDREDIGTRFLAPGRRVVRPVRRTRFRPAWPRTEPADPRPLAVWVVIGSEAGVSQRGGNRAETSLTSGLACVQRIMPHRIGGGARIWGRVRFRPLSK